MFFSEEYNEENVARLSKKIAGFGSFDVCYEADPRKPVLLSLARIYSKSSIFKMYKSSFNQAMCDECNANGSKFVK